MRAGCDYVTGSRFRGGIEADAMPKLHRYFGTPVTTFILNRIFGSRFSDIHCGMRGITREALRRLDLRSQSWEYASEMTIKALHLGLECAEVPIRFLRGSGGSPESHEARGWLEPWRAGWQNSAHRLPPRAESRRFGETEQLLEFHRRHDGPVFLVL